MAWKNYRLAIPEEHGPETGRIEQSPFVLHIEDDGMYWPFLWYERNRDLFRLLTRRQNEQVVLDGETIFVREIQARTGGYSGVHPRPRSQIRGVGTSDDLVLIASFDICDEPYCVPFEFYWEDIEKPELFSKIRWQITSF